MTQGPHEPGSPAKAWRHADLFLTVGGFSLILAFGALIGVASEGRAGFLAAAICVFTLAAIVGRLCSSRLLAIWVLLLLGMITFAVFSVLLQRPPPPPPEPSWLTKLWHSTLGTTPKPEEPLRIHGLDGLFQTLLAMFLGSAFVIGVFGVLVGHALRPKPPGHAADDAGRASDGSANTALRAGPA